MERKQDGLVPIGEALADLDGPVQAIRKTPPPARRSFTVADQVHQLVSASEADPDLGRSLAEFMRTLGIYHNSGGRGGVQTRLRNQMNRLFGCTVSLIYEDESSFVRVTSSVADKQEFWWSNHKPDELSLWESKIELGEKFFNEIIRHPVPLDMNTLKALKRSTLGLDLYLWLTYRTFALRAPQRLTWKQLYQQFDTAPHQRGR